MCIWLVRAVLSSSKVACSPGDVVWSSRACMVHRPLFFPVSIKTYIYLFCGINPNKNIKQPCVLLPLSCPCTYFPIKCHIPINNISSSLCILFFSQFHTLKQIIFRYTSLFCFTVSLTSYIPVPFPYFHPLCVYHLFYSSLYITNTFSTFSSFIHALNV